jgi:YD repeat-containing protein
MALGRITAITDGVDAAQTQQFQYDALSRLVRSEHAAGNVASYRRPPPHTPLNNAAIWSPIPNDKEIGRAYCLTSMRQPQRSSSTVARPRKVKKPITSVTVVRKMLLASAGS